MSDPWLVVGLGNPGSEYEATRHNIGFLVVDELGSRMGAKLARHKKAHALAAEGRFGLPGDQVRVVLLEPLTFMNSSGGAVKAAASFYGIGPERMIAVHDELDIPFAAIRVKLGGGDNGHNGLKSMRSSLGTGDFYRVRVGIGRPPGRQDPADYVLKPWGGAERKELPLLVDRAADAVECLVRQGLEAAQNQFNS